jgi:iron complex transport system substrate-binding protein
VTVTDAKGSDVTVDDLSRIVVLNGDIAEIIFALGLGDSVVGTDISATYPEEAAAKSSVGYQRALSAEGILSLEPTLVIGDQNAGPPEVLDQVRSAGVPTLILKAYFSIDDIETKITNIAHALGVPNRGAALWANTEADINEAKAIARDAKTEPKVAFLYLRGAQVQFIGGRGSGADSLIAAAGAIDAGSASGLSAFVPITAEALVEAEPDAIIVLSAGLESVGGIDGLLKVPGVAETPAGENRAIYDFEDQFFLGLGPRTGQALLELVQSLHPELS